MKLAKLYLISACLTAKSCVVDISAVSIRQAKTTALFIFRLLQNSVLSFQTGIKNNKPRRRMKFNLKYAILGDIDTQYVTLFF